MKRVKRIIHCPANSSGRGIVVAVMDTGAVLHPELAGRFLVFKDFVNGREDMYDDNGHGTHVCGIISGKTVGIAPESHLIILKVLDENGKGKTEYSMRGFRWILENQEKYNIRIVNISMGMNDDKEMLPAQRILKGVEMLWDMGIVVVTSAGNMGPKEGSITIPGIHEKIITVGSSDIYRSGRGSIKANMLKPDLVAPGANITSCNSNWKTGPLYVKKSGTSMSTPIVSGAIAELLSRNPNIPNVEIKHLLKKSCENLGVDFTWQGSGLLNMKKITLSRKNA